MKRRATIAARQKRKTSQAGQFAASYKNINWFLGLRAYPYDTFLTKFKPECSQCTCCFVRVFIVVLNFLLVHPNPSSVLNSVSTDLYPVVLYFSLGFL